MKRTYLMMIMALCAGAQIQAMDQPKPKTQEVHTQTDIRVITLPVAKTTPRNQQWFFGKWFHTDTDIVVRGLPANAETQTDTDIAVRPIAKSSTNQKWFKNPLYVKAGIAVGAAAAIGYHYANDIRYGTLSSAIKADMTRVVRGIGRVGSGMFEYMEYLCKNYPSTVALMLGLGPLNKMSGLTFNNTYTVVTNNNKDKSNCGFKTIIGGVPEEIKQIAEMIQGDADIKERYAQFVVAYPKGILLYGPPGTGKTLLAKAIAEEIKCPFIETNASQFLTAWQGSGAANVKQLFETAQKAAANDKSGKAIVFIDEIDAIGDRKGGELHHEAKKALTTLLTTMDGFTKDDSVIVIAATNSMEGIDDALLRPGRFDKKIEITLPDCAKRKALLEYYSANRPISIAISFDTMADRLEGYSAADVKEIMNAAAGIALGKGAEYITQDALNQAIKNLKKEQHDKKLYEHMYT